MGCLIYHLILRFLKRFHLFIFRERGEGRETERERNIIVWLPLMCLLLGAWPATQACALTGNQTSGPFVRRLALNPVSHTSQDLFWDFFCWPEELDFSGVKKVIWFRSKGEQRLNRFQCKNINYDFCSQKDSKRNDVNIDYSPNVSCPWIPLVILVHL